MSIQRYHIWCEWDVNIGPLDDGDYVAYADHLAAITAERERADRADKRSEFHHQNHLAAEREIDALRERVARLVGALEAITRRVPIMASTGDYRTGQLHALEACAEVARTALEGK